MPDFTTADLLDGSAPLNLSEVTDPSARQAVLAALDAELTRNIADIAVRMGAVWDRKGFPQTGSVSEKVSPGTGYRYGADTLILVAITVDRYSHADPTKTAWELVAAADERAKAEAEEAARNAKLARAADLRAEAERLEAEAEKVGNSQ